MSHAAAAALGAIAGATIFIGLPVGRIRGFSRTVQGILNAIATGVLIFLLWDILSHASGPVETALAALHRGDGGFFTLVAIFAAGIALGLLGLVYFNGRFYVLFLAVAAGALRSVVNVMFHLGRRLNSPAAMGWGLLFGFLLGYATDLVLTYNAA